MNDIVARLDALRERLSDEEFLTNKGLSNEVGLYIFAYKPAEEMAVRFFIKGLMEKQSAGGLPFRIKRFDLYDIMLNICREKRILERVPQMEKQRGQDFIMKQVQKLAPPEAYVTHMKYDGHQRGDVVFITGVGRVYYYTKFGRNLVRQTFRNCEIDILTQDVPECIDHIAVSKGFAGERASVAEWNKDKSLSDHKGIVVEIN